MKVQRCWIFFVLLVCCGLLTNGTGSASAQETNTQQTPILSEQGKTQKKKIEKIGNGHIVTIVVKNGDRFQGSILSIRR